MFVDSDCRSTETMRKVTIASKVRDAIRDAKELQREQTSMKFVKNEMIPPLTAIYRQNRSSREVERLQKILKSEVVKCDKNDIHRQQLLETVLAKCTNLKESLGSLEGAIAQLQKQQETHTQIIISIKQEIEEDSVSMKRYIKAAEDLAAIRELMEWVINENTCYVKFLENVALESKRYSSATEITGRYDKLLAVKKTLSEGVDEALLKIEKTRQLIMDEKFAASVEKNYALQRLQSIDYELNAVKSKTANFEKALNNINVDSADQLRNMNLVLIGVERIIQKQIQAKVLDKSYSKKTFAQQVEAIRNNYMKDKAILKEYNRTLDSMKAKRAKQLKAFEKYEAILIGRNTTAKRLSELYNKKRMNDLKKQEVFHARKIRRLKSRVGYEDLADEPTSDFTTREAEVDLTAPEWKKSLIPDSDDFDTDEEQGIEDVLATYSINNGTFDTRLKAAESEDFIMGKQPSAVEPSIKTETNSSIDSYNYASTTASSLFMPRRMTQHKRSLSSLT